MRIKEDKPIFLKIVLLSISVVLINLVYFVYSSSKSSGLTGFSIKGSLTNFSSNLMNLSMFTKIFFIMEIGFIMGILMYSFRRDIKINQIKLNESGISLDKHLDVYKTELDSLYKLLKEKKQLRISTIARLFNITKENAMEWSRILETANLALIDYPSFGDAILVYEEKQFTSELHKPITLIKSEEDIKKEIEMNNGNNLIELKKPIKELNPDKKIRKK